MDISVCGTTATFAQYPRTDIGLEKSEKHRGDRDQCPRTEMAISVYGSKIGRWAAHLSWNIIPWGWSGKLSARRYEVTCNTHMEIYTHIRIGIFWSWFRTRNLASVPLFILVRIPIYLVIVR